MDKGSLLIFMSRAILGRGVNFSRKRNYRTISIMCQVEGFRQKFKKDLKFDTKMSIEKIVKSSDPLFDTQNSEVLR